MLYVIICEGKTDSVIINHFMTSYGFKYLKKNPNKFVFNLIGKQTVEYFKNSENGDALQSVGFALANWVVSHHPNHFLLEWQAPLHQ